MFADHHDCAQHHRRQTVDRQPRRDGNHQPWNWARPQAKILPLLVLLQGTAQKGWIYVYLWKLFETEPIL